MGLSDSNIKGYLIATFVGAVGGGLLALFTSKTLPKIMSQVMSNMMKNMMPQMGEGSCNPEEM
jgi:hypothetical protein